MTRAPDICRPCADDAGTPWPAGATGVFYGLCHWCGNDGKSLMAVAELPETDFFEVQHYV